MLGNAIMFWVGPVDPSMSPTYRLAATWTTVCIAAGSVTVALHQFYISERWKRAEAARDLVDNLLDNPGALAALQMTEHETGEMFESGTESFSVSADDICTALSDWDQQDAKCRLIRRNFQLLGFYLARLNLFLEKGYVDSDRILPFFTIHSPSLAELEPYVSDFYKHIGYVGAAKFVARIIGINENN